MINAALSGIAVGCFLSDTLLLAHHGGETSLLTGILDCTLRVRLQEELGERSLSSESFLSGDRKDRSQISAQETDPFAIDFFIVASLARSSPAGLLRQSQAKKG